jgi:hypothetical protein
MLNQINKVYCFGIQNNEIVFAFSMLLNEGVLKAFFIVSVELGQIIYL